MIRITTLAIALGLSFSSALAAGAQDVRGHALDLEPKGPEFPGPILPPGNIPPAPIGDLVEAGSGIASITVTWTAPSDPDGFSGTVAGYDIRFSTLDPLTFDSDDEWYVRANEADDEPTPSGPGGTDSMTISGLKEGTTYYVAVTSTDGSSWSGVSNVVTVVALSTPAVTDPHGPPPPPVDETDGNSSSSCGNSSTGGAGIAMAALVALAATRGGRR